MLIIQKVKIIWTFNKIFFDWNISNIEFFEHFMLRFPLNFIKIPIIYLKMLHPVEHYSSLIHSVVQSKMGARDCSDMKIHFSFPSRSSSHETEEKSRFDRVNSTWTTNAPSARFERGNDSREKRKTDTIYVTHFGGVIDDWVRKRSVRMSRCFCWWNVNDGEWRKKYFSSSFSRIFIIDVAGMESCCLFVVIVIEIVNTLSRNTWSSNVKLKEANEIFPFSS